MKTATSDLTGEGRDYLGTLFIGGTHSASSGGAWMSVVFGLCGIRWDGENLYINLKLPAHWLKVVVPFTVHGLKLAITISRDSVTVKPVSRMEKPLPVSVGETTRSLQSGEELVVPISMSPAVDESIG